MTATPAPIRDASTVIVLRDRDSTPRVLMGQRGAKAAFMPNKFVFPGGAVDQGDATIPLVNALPQICFDRLAQDSTGADLANALAAAAIRELWEETGLLLGTPGHWPEAPADWAGFAGKGLRPDAAALQFVFRAITPVGRPRRFDARFFLLDAAALIGDPHDFSDASDELSHLQWIPLSEVRQFDLPFITEVVLAEIAARVTDPLPPETVPFFKNDDEQNLFLRLKGSEPNP